VKQKIMQINRQTYEEFFLLYTDGELNLDEKKAVEDFIIENPDLKEELILMQEVTFEPDEEIIFEDKASLYREEERKVVPLPWFKLAAAAIILLAFGIFGWLYTGEKNTVKTDTVASAEKMPEQHHPLKTVEATVTTRTDAVTRPAEPVNKKINTATISPNAFVSSNIKKHKKVSVIKLPVHTLPDEDIVMNHVNKEDITVQVEGRELATNNIVAVNQPIEKVEYGESGDNDMIYFANTSLPKKSKLRGVFRKASRILDKVTSLQ
jgi:hypothetical protein